MDAPKAYNVVVYLVCLYLACCLSRVQDRIDACYDCGLGTSHGNFMEVVECSSFSTFTNCMLGRPPKQVPKTSTWWKMEALKTPKVESQP